MVDINRRVVASWLAASAAAPLAAGTAWGQAEPTGPRRRIDVHHHILPPAYLATMGTQAIGAPAPNRETPRWQVSDSLEAMDRNGITSAIVSVSAPGVLMPDASQTRLLARTCNEFAARMVADYPTRFGMFACLPLPDVDAAMKEIEHAFMSLKTDGIGLMTNYADRYLGDPAFVPVFDELNRRKAVVYVHPTSCNCNAGILVSQPHSLIEFPHDSTRAITSLLFSGTFSRCPDIRFIFSHAGGTLPYLAPRIALIGSLDRDLAKRVPGGVMPALKRLYYDTASSANPITFGALMKFVTPQNVVLGTDFPFIPEAGMKATLDGLRKLGLADADLRAIEGENASGLFTRLVGR